MELSKNGEKLRRKDGREGGGRKGRERRNKGRDGKKEVREEWRKEAGICGHLLQDLHEGRKGRREGKDKQINKHITIFFFQCFHLESHIKSDCVIYWKSNGLESTSQEHQLSKY